VAHGSTSHAEPAVDRFRDLLQGPLDRVSLEKATPVLRMAAEWQGRDDLRSTAYQRGLELVKDKGEVEPHAALAVLELIAPLALKKDEFMKAQRPLLEQLAAKRPDDIEFASALAVVYEHQGETARCEQLLL